MCLLGDFCLSEIVGTMADDIHQTTPFVWNAKRERAAILVAEDEIPDHAIAKEVGVTKKTLENWKLHPDFQAHVGGHVGQIQAGMLKLAIAKKHKRLEVLDDLYRRALDVVELRAMQYAPVDGTQEAAGAAARRIFGNGNVPEAITGLLVKKETPTNTGRVAVEWNVDTGLMKEIRALQEQASKELGQWVERSEVEQRTNIVQLINVPAESI